MIKYIVRHPNPQILVITPLLTGHSISKETKNSIKRNKTPFVWISYLGPNNAYLNTQKAFNIYRNDYELPKYVIKIDNDIISQRGMLDEMYKTLESSKDDEAYCYCPFSFQGHINISFPYTPFNAERLRQNNYISSISMIKTKRLVECGLFVTDVRGERLLDWALWLKLLKRGYIGVPTQKTSFVAISNKDNVSSRSNDDYQQKRRWVLENFT
jgi:hypothetical protein